jgi:hypothetical protein
MAGFGIGSGEVKLHPVVVQSGSAVLTPGTVATGPMTQLEPEQSSANRLADPAGVTAVPSVDMAPPILRLDEARGIDGQPFLGRLDAASSVVAHGGFDSAFSMHPFSVTGSEYFAATFARHAESNATPLPSALA